MKQAGATILVLVIIAIIATIVEDVKTDYNYSKTYSSYWEIADRSSTIEKKIEYIDKYVEAVKSAKLEGEHNAAVFKTDENSFDKNFEALLSLQDRLHQIRKMDINSFQYQTAIQQITEQEMGQAGQMLGIIKGAWYKRHYPLLWNWWCLLWVLGLIVIGVFSVAMIVEL